MTDPYAPVASAPPMDDENEAFINLGHPDYVVPNTSAYDDNDDNVNTKLNAYSSAPDPTLSSAANGDNFPAFQNLAAQNDHQTVLDEEDEGFGHSTYGQRMDYQTAPYQDKCFLFLWILHLIAMLAVLIYEWSDTQIVIKEANAGFLIVFVCAVIGVILGYIWTKVIRKYSGKIIKFMLWGNLCCLSAAALFHFIFLHMVSAILYSLFAAIFGLYMWSIWRRIPFTETMIDISCLIINMYQSTIAVFECFYSLLHSVYM